MAFLDWLSGIFGPGGGVGSDIDAATAALTSGTGGVAAPGMFDGPPVLGTGNQTLGVPGGDQPLAQPADTAAGGNAIADALKSLKGSDLTKQPDAPKFLQGATPPQSRGNAAALSQLTNMLNQRQADLLQAQQRGAPPPQYRTVGLLGF